MFCLSLVTYLLHINFILYCADWGLWNETLIFELYVKYLVKWRLEIQRKGHTRH